MRNDWKFGRFVLTAVVLGFGSLAVAVAAVAWGIARQQDSNRWVLHTYEVETAISEFRFWTERIEVLRRGHLIQLDQRFTDGFQRAREELPKVVDRIRSLTNDNPSQQERVERLREAADRQIAEVAAAFADRRSRSEAAASADLFGDGSFEAIGALREISVEMVDEERRLLDERLVADRRSLVLAYSTLAIAGLLLLVVGAGTIWIVWSNLKDLQASRNTLRDLNENLEEAVEERTADLKRANAEIQRFAYIVSHDLRSPLVNVMGFTSELDAATKPLADLVDKVEAEVPHLASEDARLAVREDLPEAIGFIRSSTQKMDRLINAILKLSREGRRVIAPERLKVEDVLGGIADSLQHRMSETGAQVHVEKPLPDVVSDRVAVEQIFSNLVENAIKYAEPGRPVRVDVRGATRSGRVVYEVADNGRGIDNRDLDRVFDLFRRSGAQDQPGEGIGLAHVRALAYRLGGNIACSSELGKGSVFSLTLPPVYRPQERADA